MQKHSKSCRQAKLAERAGSEWLPKWRLWARLSQGSRLNLNASYVQWGFDSKRFFPINIIAHQINLKAHVTHPELKTTFCLPIVGVKKNPSSQLYTSLGVITKGTIIEVNVSELGMVTQGGKVVWAKYAQVTNHPENDGCINAVLLVWSFMFHVDFFVMINITYGYFWLVFLLMPQKITFYII